MVTLPGANDYMQLVLSAGLDRSLQRLVVSASWQLSSSDLEGIMRRCRKLQQLCRSGSAPMATQPSDGY
jgi:hypothetical protein